MKKLIIILPAVALLAAACNSKQPINNQGVNNMQKDLEAVYNRYLDSLKNKDYEAFKAAVDPEGEIKLVDMRGRFEAFAEMSNNPDFPDLRKNTFVETKDISKAVGIDNLVLYVSQFKIEDEPNLIGLKFIAFRKIADGWRIWHDTNEYYDKSGKDPAFARSYEQLMSEYLEKQKELKATLIK